METVQTAGIGVLTAALMSGLWWLLGGAFTHRRKLKKLGKSLGLRPDSDTSDLKQSGLLDTSLLSDESARCENPLRGSVRGAEAVIVGYSRKGRTADPVAAFRVQDKKLPVFELRPRLSSNDPRGLSFDANPRFSDIYSLTGQDEAALRALFAGEILTFFERSENQDWAVASTGEWLGVTVWPHGQRARRLEAKQVMGFVEDAKQVLFLLKDG